MLFLCVHIQIMLMGPMLYNVLHIYANHVHIKISVLDVNYHQFQNVMRELDIVVVNRKIFSSITLNKPREYWSTGMHHRWTWHGLIQSSDADRISGNMCKTVRKMDKFYMIRSSHMGYYYHYLLAECRLFNKKLLEADSVCSSAVWTGFRIIHSWLCRWNFKYKLHQRHKMSLYGWSQIFSWP